MIGHLDNSQTTMQGTILKKVGYVQYYQGHFHTKGTVEGNKVISAKWKQIKNTFSWRDPSNGRPCHPTPSPFSSGHTEIQNET
jgi:hypothetical protein